MNHEIEMEYRKLAIELLDTFGEPLFNMFIKTLGNDGRLLNTAADGIWIGSRKQIMKFPPELIQELKPYKGTRRIQKFLLRIAPSFIMAAPIEVVEDTLSQLYPILDKMNDIRKRGDLADGKVKS